MINFKAFVDRYNQVLFPLSKYLKYGLLSDDLVRENHVIKEALKRLPKEVYQERQFRLARAIGLSANKDVLPENEWTTLEQVDFNKFYKRIFNFFFINKKKFKRTSAI